MHPRYLIIALLTLIFSTQFAFSIVELAPDCFEAKQIECVADKITHLEGDTTQTICLFNAQKRLRLDAVTRNEHETRVDLRFFGDNTHNFCVWPVDHPRQFVLFDTETNKSYRLLSQATLVAFCKNSDNDFTFIPYNDTRLLRLYFDGLPKQATQLMLIETGVSDNIRQETAIGPFVLHALK